MAKTIAELEKAIAQLNQQKLQLQAQEEKKKRALETKQKAILGGWLMANDPDQVKRIVAKLKRPQDRKAFNLQEGVGDLAGRAAELHFAAV